jgi:uncharacterized protein (UPF0264 family)
MQAAISPMSLESARIVAQCGPDIIDIEHVKAGSSAASFPWTISEIVRELSRYPVEYCATLGDLPVEPGMAALAAFGAAAAGVEYVKAGLYEVTNEEQGVELIDAVRRACKHFNPEVSVITVGYADHRRVGALSPDALVRIAQRSKSDFAMLDLAIKNGATLFDAMPLEEIEEFISTARKAGLKTALAGSLDLDHMSVLHELQPDIVNVRACKATQDRVEEKNVRAFLQALRDQSAVNPL